MATVTNGIDEAGRAMPRGGTRVLVAYATRFGSTQGIAERIADVLQTSGLDATLSSAGAVDDVDGFEAVVIGSPIFNQRWLPEADELARRHAGALAQRPVWLFSVATFSDRKRLVGPLMRREPKNVAALHEQLRPRGYRVFAGVIERAHWPLPSRLFYHAFGGRLGDNRDWNDIAAWAGTIVEAVRGATPEEVVDPARGSSELAGPGRSGERGRR